MREGRASGTAEIVAGWRSLGDRGHTSVPGFSDPYAGRLVRGRWAALAALQRAGLELAPAAVRPALVDRYDYILLRTATLDALLRDALGRGARQLVILGAGLDTRAWRLPELAGVRLFEVDHPATQAVKWYRSTGLGWPHTVPTHVPVDFAVDDLAERLAARGHDATAPTVWLWEGVVMYLPDAAVRATLAAVRARSAPGSTLLLHYHAPDRWSGARLYRQLLVRAIGEPLIGLRTPAAIDALVREAGFTPVEDLGVDEQARLVGGRASRKASRRASRISVSKL